MMSSSESGADSKSTGLLLETIGVLSAQSIYLTYSSIGTMADGHANKTYKDDFALQMFSEYSSISTGAIKQLNKLLSSGVLTGQDIKFVSDLIATYELLISESNAYKNYVSTGNKDYLKVYSDKRKLAWKNISELLGLK